MKKIYVFIFVLPVLMTSCFKDLGNYDYKTFEDFEVSGLESSYNVVSFVENLKITPVVTPEDNEFEYEWFVTESRKGLHQIEEYAVVLSRDKVLDVPFEYPTGTYELYLKVTDKISGDAEFVSMTVNAVTPFLNGYYVLYETGDGNTEMDIHYPDGNVTTAAVSAFTGTSLAGKPKALSYMPEMSYLDEDTGSNVVNYVMAPSSENGMVSFDMTDMSVARKNDQWFYGDYDISGIRHISSFGYNVIIFSKSGVHSNYQIVNGPWVQLSAGKFSPMPDVMDGAAYEVSSDVCYFGDMAFFHDALNNRFISIDVNGGLKVCTLQSPSPVEGEEPVPEKIDGKVIFMGGISPSGVNGYNFRDYMVIIAEGSDTGRTCYYVKPDGQRGLDIVRKIKFEAGSPFAAASFYTSSKNGANYLYAVSDNKIYSMNPSTGAVEELTFTSRPEGEITYFQTMFNVMEDQNSDAYFNGFVMATFSSGKYHVALYDMIGGLPVLNQGPAKTFGGEGKVKSIQFASQTKKAGVMNIGNSVYSIHY